MRFVSLSFMVHFHCPTPIIMKLGSMIMCRTVSTEPTPIPIVIPNPIPMATVPNLAPITVHRNHYKNRHRNRSQWSLCSLHRNRCRNQNRNPESGSGNAPLMLLKSLTHAIRSPYLEAFLVLVEVVEGCGSVRKPKSEFARTLHRLLGIRNQRGVQYTHVVHQYCLPVKKIKQL